MTGEEWFSTDLAKGLSRLYNNSHVQAFVDAEEYYTDLRKEVEAAGKGGRKKAAFGSVMPAKQAAPTWR